MNRLKEKGKEYGYNHISLVFEKFRDLKVRWQRTYSDIEFQFPDYLEDMPEDCLLDMLDVLFKRILGIEYDGPMYPKDVQDYLLDESFIEKYRHVYLDRFNNIKDIGMLYNNIFVVRDLDNDLGGSSALFKVIMLAKHETINDDLRYRIDQIEEGRRRIRE